MENAATTMADVVTAMTTAMGTVASNALDGIEAIVPVAAPVLGAILIVGIGIRAFKKIAGR